MTDTTRSSRREPTDLTVPAARLALAAAVATPVLLAGLGFLSPELDPSYRMVSEYAFGRYGWVLSLTFLAWGISSWALAFAIRPRIRTRGGRVGLAFLVVAGLGAALASVFDVRHDLMHNLAGAMGILGLPVAAILITASLGRNPEWSQAKRVLLVLANLTWISVVLLVAAFALMTASFVHVYGSLPAQAPPTLPAGVIGLVGWADRLLVVVYCAWVTAVAAWALRLATRPAPPAGAVGR
jgi:Protein of unknown function (DUF998)